MYIHRPYRGPAIAAEVNYIRTHIAGSHVTYVHTLAIARDGGASARDRARAFSLAHHPRDSGRVARAQK
eukprot:1206390-Pleurochrysis_carterae.AAC.1